jgi:hypothetical protein
MSSSFASSLRKLAEEAAEARRVVLEKGKLAEKTARAEALRIQRLEEARAREAARLALLQAEKEKRELDAEAERQRRQAEATKQAEQRRIEADKRKAEMEERDKREEEERTRLRELRKAQLCSDIYGALAVAAWDGVQEAVVDDEALGFKAELHTFGIEVSRRSKLARLATDALAELVLAADQFSRVIDTTKEAGFADKLRSLTERIQNSGQPKLASQISNFAEQVVKLSAFVCDRAEKVHQNLLGTVGTQERAIEALESDVCKLEVQLADAVANVRRKEKRLMWVANRIKAHVDEIGSSYQAHLPARLELRNYVTKAAALRLAYGRFIHDVDFEMFSVLEIINLFRQADGRQPMDSLFPVPDEDRGYFDQNGAVDESTAALNRRLARMSNYLSSAKTGLASTRANITSARSDIRLANDFRAKANSFHNSCIQFERSLCKSLEGVDRVQLRFDEGQYVGPTMARLDAETPASDIPIAKAYAELLWLATGDGRDFAGYMDIVLSELAKDGARSVDLSFVDGDIESHIVVGKVSLVCKIGSPLMELLFARRGIAVEKKSGIEGSEILFRLSW